MNVGISARGRYRWAAALSILLIAAGASSPSATPVAALSHGESVGGERLCMAVQLRAFYDRRNQQPAWDQGSLSELRAAIDGAAADGLIPSRYHRAALDTASGAALDVLATDAFLLLGAHLSRGVVDPDVLLPAWCSPPRDLDLAAVLQAAIENRNIGESLARLAPQHAGYRRLRAALALYRDLERRGGWASVASGPPLRPEMRDIRVPALRLRLAREPLTIEPPSYPVLDLRSDSYDPALAGIVRTFQERHGAEPDGVVGPETLRELNIPLPARIHQIEANLERWRWMPGSLGSRYLIVNIAAFRLEVFDGGRRAMVMKTVVGKQFTRTPFFAARITDIVVNPWWNVPRSIAAKELWPHQRRDPQFFAREHLVVTRDGRIRQTPGEWNSLGRLKFNLPNRYDVYLHDTPAKALFSRTRRAFSHGCIRLERPLDLALFLLDERPEWDAAAIEQTIEGRAETDITLRTPVPVYVLYWTATVTERGELELLPDVYGRDDAVEKAMTAAQ